MYIDGGPFNPRLPDVLSDLATATFDPLDDHLAFVQSNLTADQREAVRRALATRDLFLLQGPPGTGKTTVLAEIILQELIRRPDARILVSSQSNVAVNHVLARVAALSGERPIEFVRIGRADKIGQGAEQWTLGQRLARWREEVLARTDPVLQHLKQRQQALEGWRTAPARHDEVVQADLQQCARWLEELRPVFAQSFSLLASCGADETLVAVLAPRRADVRPDEAVSAELPSAAALASAGPAAGTEDLASPVSAIEETLALIEASLPDKTAAIYATMDGADMAHRSPPPGSLHGDRAGGASAALAEPAAAGEAIGEAIQAPMLSAVQMRLDRAAQTAHQLETALAVALDPEPALVRTKERLELVNNWRKVFGKQSDFARPVFERASVIAATCLITGSALVRREEFDLILIDEAGRATPPELLVPLVRGRRAVIVGDERQLPPMLDEELTADRLTAAGFTRAQLSESLFATLVAQAESHQLPVVQMLKVQHRMHPAIGRLISDVFYGGRLSHGVTAAERAHGLSTFARPIVWRSTSHLPSRFETRRGTSYYNGAEVRHIAQALLGMESAYRRRGEQRDVAVISPYQAQLDELQRQIQPETATWQALRIELATVDSVQGRDCDIVFFSPVRSNREQRVGFLRDRRRLNVSLSRARQLLVIVGDLVTLENAHTGPDGNPYQELVRYLRDHPDDCAIENIAEAVGASEVVEDRR